MTVSNDVTTARKLDGKIENKHRTLASTGFREQADTRTRTCVQSPPFNEEDTASKRKNVKMVAKANDCARREGRAQGWVFCGR